MDIITTKHKAQIIVLQITQAKHITSNSEHGLNPKEILLL